MDQEQGKGAIQADPRNFLIASIMYILLGLNVCLTSGSNARSHEHCTSPPCSPPSKSKNSIHSPNDNTTPPSNVLGTISSPCSFSFCSKFSPWAFFSAFSTLPII